MISDKQVLRLYKLAVENTPAINHSKELELGFLVGFRCYEKLADALSRPLTDAEVARVQHGKGWTDER